MTCIVLADDDFAGLLADLRAHRPGPGRRRRRTGAAPRRRPRRPHPGAGAGRGPRHRAVRAREPARRDLRRPLGRRPVAAVPRAAARPVGRGPPAHAHPQHPDQRGWPQCRAPPGPGRGARRRPGRRRRPTPGARRAASAGLNLLLDRYAVTYRRDGVVVATVGDPASPVQLFVRVPWPRRPPPRRTPGAHRVAGRARPEPRRRHRPRRVPLAVGLRVAGRARSPRAPGGSHRGRPPRSSPPAHR